MTTQVDQKWDSLIAELNFFGTLEEGWDGHGIQAPGQSLVQNALALAETFRGWGSLPASRVSSQVPGLIHFEWLTAASHVVIALSKDGTAEVVSFTNGGLFHSEVYRWDHHSIQELERGESSLRDCIG